MGRARRRGLVAGACTTAVTLASLVLVDVRAQESVEPPEDQPAETEYEGSESGPPPMGAPHETADRTTPPPEDAPVEGSSTLDESTIPVAVTRVSGATRYETAALLAMSFDTGGTVFVASGLGYADALAGGPVASMEGAPILLVSRDEIPQETADALDALEPAEIVVLGGTSAVSGAVESDLSQWAGVTRVAGADRFETARDLALRGFGGGVDDVYVATGRSFPDALSGGSLGAAQSDGAPILLVDTNSVPAATWDALDALAPSTITILGGPGVVSDAVEAELSSVGEVVRIAGGDRYETSAMIAEQSDLAATVVFVATGGNFPDALAAAPLIGWYEGPTILVPSSGGIPARTAEALGAFWSIEQVVAIGGTGALPDGVLAELYDIVNGGGQ